MSKSLLFHKRELDFRYIDFFFPAFIFLALLITAIFNNFFNIDIIKTLAIKDFTISRFNIEYLMQILQYKSYVVRYIFVKNNLCNNEKYDQYSKKIANKEKKNLCAKICKNQDIDQDLYGKKVIDKREKNLRKRAYKSQDEDQIVEILKIQEYRAETV